MRRRLYAVSVANVSDARTNTRAITGRMGRTLAIGDRLPDLTLPGPAGKPFRLHDLVGRKTLVIYFYPKDETPGCTAQACGFRDAYEDFTAAGAEVIGISADSASSHESFAQHHRLPFVLLSDPDGTARAAFGVKKTLGLLAGRVTFVIDRSGFVKHVFDSQIRFGKHVDEALAMVKQLEKAA